LRKIGRGQRVNGVGKIGGDNILHQEGKEGKQPLNNLKRASFGGGRRKEGEGFLRKRRGEKSLPRKEKELESFHPCEKEKGGEGGSS